MKEIKLIFIDIDNTLLDFDAYTEESLKEGFKKYNLGSFNPTILDVFHYENNILWEKLERKEITLKELRDTRFDIIFKKLGISFSGKEFEKYYSNALFDSAIKIENAEEMLRYLKDKYILATASNGPYLQQLHRLEIAGFYQYFTYFFISENIGYSKPSKEFFAKAFEEINKNRNNPIVPQETLIIGDSMTSDMKGGKDFGIKTCFFDKHKRGIKPETDFFMSNLSQIKGIL